MSPLYQLSYTTPAGVSLTLADYTGYVILIVNTATACGLTPQFVELEKLYQTYKDQKFVVIGFPCNQFASQEPVSDIDMIQTCQKNYGVSFPMSSKINVNGDNTHPVFAYLKGSINNGILGDMIKRNFSKFLIDREGKTIARYAPTTMPTDIQDDIVSLL